MLILTCRPPVLAAMKVTSSQGAGGPVLDLAPMRSAHTSPTFNTEEDRAFLQRRDALFGLIAGGSYFFFFVYRTIFSLAVGVSEEIRGPAYWLHLTASLVLFALLGR